MQRRSKLKLRLRKNAMPVKFTFAKPLMKTWLLIHQVHSLLRRSENAIFAQLGLTDKRHSVLLALKNLEAPVMVADVARWLDRNANGISMLVNRMEKEGLVSKTRDSQDQRIVRLEITQKGEKFFNEAKRLTRQLFQDLFSGIEEEDLRKMSALLQKVRGKTLDFLKLNHAKDVKQVLNEKDEFDEYDDEK